MGMYNIKSSSELRSVQVPGEVVGHIHLKHAGVCWVLKQIGFFSATYLRPGPVQHKEMGFGVFLKKEKLQLLFQRQLHFSFLEQQRATLPDRHQIKGVRNQLSDFRQALQLECQVYGIREVLERGKRDQECLPHMTGKQQQTLECTMVLFIKFQWLPFQCLQENAIIPTSQSLFNAFQSLIFHLSSHLILWCFNWSIFSLTLHFNASFHIGLQPQIFFLLECLLPTFLIQFFFS